MAEALFSLFLILTTFPYFFIRIFLFIKKENLNKDYYLIISISDLIFLTVHFLLYCFDLIFF